MADNDVIRRLTTILAADVVGYSRLMAADEEDTIRRLRAYREIIYGLLERHRGRVFNTAGDAVLAEFGSTVEAVRCAISIQEELAVRNAQLPDDHKMMFRIGINVGDVIVEGDDLFGDGVNVAARLESIAAPGSVCISGSTFEQVKTKLTIGFEDRGMQEVKNIPHPVAAFQIVAGPPATTQPAKAVKSRKMLWIAAGAAAVVVVAGVGVFFALGRGGTDQGTQTVTVRHATTTLPQSGALTGPQIKALLTGRTARFDRRSRFEEANAVFVLGFKDGGLINVKCTLIPDKTPKPRPCGRPPPTGTWSIEGDLLCFRITRPGCFKVERHGQSFSLRQVPEGRALLGGPFTLIK